MIFAMLSRRKNLLKVALPVLALAGHYPRRKQAPKLIQSTRHPVVSVRGMASFRAMRPGAGQVHPAHQALASGAPLQIWR